MHRFSLLLLLFRNSLGLNHLCVCWLADTLTLHTHTTTIHSLASYRKKDHAPCSRHWNALASTRTRSLANTHTHTEPRQRTHQKMHQTDWQKHYSDGLLEAILWYNFEPNGSMGPRIELHWPFLLSDTTHATANRIVLDRLLVFRCVCVFGNVLCSVLVHCYCDGLWWSFMSASISVCCRNSRVKYQRKIVFTIESNGVWP